MSEPASPDEDSPPAEGFDPFIADAEGESVEETVAKDEPPELLIELREARLGYSDDAVIVERADLTVRRGEFWALVGPNGAGKTTVLRAILGVLAPLSGTVSCTARLGYSPQRSILDPVFPLTSRQVVAMGLIGKQPESSVPTYDAPQVVTGPSDGFLFALRKVGEHVDDLVAGLLGRQPPIDDDEVRARSRSALEACGMLEHEDRLFRDLSGGQKQRVLVARALVSEPDVLILDEPTNDLDLRGEHEVMEVIRNLHDGGRTVIMVSHILHVVSRYAKRLALLREGRLVSGALPELLTSEKLEGLYNMPVHVGEFAGHIAIAPGDAVREP